MEPAIKIFLPEIKNMLKKYGVESAWLFGSAAKQTLNEKSDIDFLIRFKDDIDYETYGNNYFELLFVTGFTKERCGFNCRRNLIESIFNSKYK